MHESMKRNDSMKLLLREFNDSKKQGKFFPRSRSTCLRKDRKMTSDRPVMTKTMVRKTMPEHPPILEEADENPFDIVEEELMMKERHDRSDFTDPTIVPVEKEESVIN